MKMCPNQSRCDLPNSSSSILTQNTTNLHAETWRFTDILLTTGSRIPGRACSGISAPCSKAALQTCAGPSAHCQQWFGVLGSGIGSRKP